MVKGQLSFQLTNYPYGTPVASKEVMGLVVKQLRSSDAPFAKTKVVMVRHRSTFEVWDVLHTSIGPKPIVKTKPSLAELRPSLAKLRKVRYRKK